MRGTRIGAVVAVLALAPVVVRGDGEPGKDARLGARHKAEVKALLPLLRTAIKEDHRRQAWYVAWRICAVAPEHAEANAALVKWKEKERLFGMGPTKAYEDKRDAVLKGEGDAYAQEARVLQVQGEKAVDTLGVMSRALAYGSRAPDLLASLDASGHEWAGTWGAQTKEVVAQAIGPIKKSVVFPPEWDSALLGARTLGWADAQVISVAGRRIVLSGDLAVAGRRATLLTAMEGFIVSRMGSMWKEPKEPIEDDDQPVFLVCPDTDTYARLVEGRIGDWKPMDKEAKRVARSSNLWWRGALLLEKHRDAPWAGEDANFCYVLAQALAYRHLAGLGGGLNGRGGWILNGLGGLFEGFKPTSAVDGAIDLDRCRYIALARALKQKGALLTWDQLVDMDTDTWEARPRESVTIRFQGTEVVAKEVDVVVAQATALVAATWFAPDGKGPKRLATLIAETIKRDHMPHLEKALGLPKGRAEKDADALLDAPGK